MKARSGAIWGTVFVIVLALLLAFVWKGWRAGVLAARADALKTEQLRLRDMHAKLRTQVISLSNIDRIKDIATRKLGLTDPSSAPVDVVTVAPLASPDSLGATGVEPGRGTKRVAPVTTVK